MQKLMFYLVALGLVMASCKSMNKTQKGAAIGVTGGAAAGAVIGKASGNTAMGAVIGAAVGGAAGAVIGHKMDKQAKEIEEKVPEAKVERVGEAITIEFNSKILFGFDQADLSTEAKNNLGKLATIMKDYPDTDIEIQGHTDDKGTDKYNQELSLRRAYAVRSYLGSKGISASRMKTMGYGESAPEYTNATDDGRAMNRRVEFIITANEKMIQDAEKEAAGN